MRYVLIIGNGLSIDFVDKHGLKDNMDLINLFTHGDKVPWPATGKPGFLSPRYCKNLWTLGARPNMPSTEAISLIEDVITCANVLNKNTHNSESIYAKAYIELQNYLKSLFIYYNKKIDDRHLDDKTWQWFDFINKLNNDEKITEIHIITLNYDIILERVLSRNNIKFDVFGMQDRGEKIKIYKPHGSISFKHKVSRESSNFEINYSMDSNDGSLSDFSVDHEANTSLDSVHAIVPPAGDSSRLDYKWSKEIREAVEQVAQKLDTDDKCITCGISYWHVDRYELDRILTSIPAEISEFKIFNPNPPKSFLAVTSTLFSNVTCHTNTSTLGEI